MPAVNTRPFVGARTVGVLLAVLLVAPASATTITDLRAIPDLGGPPHEMYWKDIAGNSYDQAFIDTFSYSDALVWMEYETYDLQHFTGTLYAEGLKPSFCYQMKLDGKPEHPDFYGLDGDDAGNEAIGYVGRWWRDQPNPGNTNDADYEAHKNDPNYVFTGYLLSDFFVTDDNGDATVLFVSDSSYHVCWKESQRPPGTHDGPSRTYDVGGTDVSIYCEWEPGRAYPGEAELRPGKYNVEFRLTEESFHDPAAFWAQAMMADEVTFHIAPEPGTFCLVLLGVALILWRSRRRRFLRDGRPSGDCTRRR